MVTGSIATDHLMTFPGRFTDSLVADQLESLSLSFLVDDLQMRRGGVAPNIASAWACSACNPVLVGAVGPDFDDYRAWLERHGVDTSGVRIATFITRPASSAPPTSDNNQIATFYAGAMSAARDIELEPLVDRLGGVDLVLVAANDPVAMLRHTDECRYRGSPVRGRSLPAAGPPDRPRDPPSRRGCGLLFTNEYEAALTLQKTGYGPRTCSTGSVSGSPRWGPRARASSGPARTRSTCRCRPERSRQGPDRRGRRVPGGIPRGAILGGRPDPGGTSRVDARHPRRGDRRDPGVRPSAGTIPGALR